MSNGMDNENNVVEEAEELLKSQEESQPSVHCIRIDVSEVSFPDDGDGIYSEQSSATATPLERSQEVAQDNLRLGDALAVAPKTVSLKEWSTLINLLARIPVKAQKGLSTLDLKLTCISTISGSEEILVIGTNVGIVYWYNRKTDVLDRLRCEGLHAVTSLNGICTVDYMVAAGNQVGIVTIFQIPRDPSQDNKTSSPSDFYDRKTKKSQRFLVQELHKGAVTALEWSRNGMKLFSGDQTGHVVVTDIDYDLVQIRSSVLLCENYEIVQLSYARRNLLICSTFRSIIYSLESKSFNKVGSQERKIMGKFGGLIVSSAWEESPKVYSVRPGARLWVANLSGVVQHTIKFKELLVSGSQPEISVIKPPKTQPRSSQNQDIQFSRVFRFMKDYLVTYHKDILHVMDARSTVVLGTCQQLRSILDVAVNKDEIFILESSRNLIRISAKADKFASSNLFNIYSSISTNTNTNNNTFHEEFSSGFKNIPDIMSASISDFRFPQEPINFLTSKFKETSTKVMPKINSTINTIKTVIEADVDIEDGQKLFGDGITQGVVALDDSDLPYLDLLSSPPHESQPVFVAEPERFQKITNLPFEDVVVEAKPNRRKKGMKRKGGLEATKKDGSSDIASDSLSVSSVYSNASTGSDNNVNAAAVGVASSSSTSSSARKLSFKSDATLSSSNSGSEGVPSTSSESKDQLGIPLSLSQSWTIGTLLPNKTVTTEELHLKEELLARRLKWPELLPDSVSADGLFDDFPGPNSLGSSEGNNCWQVNLSRREDRASIATLVGTYNPQSSDGDDTDSRTLSMENGSSLGTVIERKILREEDQGATQGDEKTQKDTQEDDSDSSESENDEDRYYVDIYTRYRNTDSFSSVLSYGPPSGSSYQSANRVPINTATIAPNGNDEVEKPEEKSISFSSLPLPPASEELDNSKEHSVDTVTTSSSVEEVDSIVESKVFTDEHWRRWRLPGSSSISQITMCDHYIICVSCKGIVYYAMLDTIGLDWKSTNYSASAIAVSPCGTVLWRIHKGDLYSLRNLAENSPVAKEGGEEWSKITQKQNVLTASVQKSFGWVVKTDGLLEFCTGLFETKLVPYFEKVYTPWPIQEVSCCGHKLWALTSDGRIVLRTGTSDLNPKGVDWLELKWSIKVAPACSISCGVVREDGVPSVWFADSNSNLYFTFDERDTRGEWTPWKVSVSNCVVYPVAPKKSLLLNSIEQVSRSFKSLVQTKSVLALCSSRNSVWFAAPESLIIYGNRNSITGHCWKPLRIDRGMTAPATWTNIYANSVYKGHGNLWITDSSGYLYYLPHGGGKLQQIDLPMFTEGQIINVAPAPEALWALTSTGDIYGRCNISSMDATGKGWRQISMCTSKSSQIVHVSCGSEVAWAVDDRGEVYMMVGSLKPPGAQDMTPAWVKVESSVCCKGVFTKVYVGANDSMVWALDNKKRVYVRQAVFPECRIGTGWLLVKGINAVMLSISDSGVWALSSNGELYRRYGITKTNFVGDYWRKTPGAATSLAVSLCDELWALNAEGYLLKHSKKSMEFARGGESASSSRSPSRIVLDEEDEDWELVDNPEF